MLDVESPRERIRSVPPDGGIIAAVFYSKTDTVLSWLVSLASLPDEGVARVSDGATAR